MGRLFDAVASLMNLFQTVSFTGQAAIALESLCSDSIVSGSNQLYVNRGLRSYFPGSLFCPPVMTVITLDKD